MRLGIIVGQGLDVTDMPHLVVKTPLARGALVQLGRLKNSL